MEEQSHFNRARQYVDEKLNILGDHKYMKLVIGLVGVFLFFFLLWPLGAFSCAIGLCVNNSAYGSGIVIFLIIGFGVLLTASVFVGTYHGCSWISANFRERRPSQGPRDGLDF